MWLRHGWAAESLTVNLLSHRIYIYSGPMVRKQTVVICYFIFLFMSTPITPDMSTPVFFLPVHFWPCLFLLLARYVLNVAKRSTWHQCIYWGPPTDLTSWKISNGHISATDHPIHLMFGSRLGFSGSADRMALLPVGANPRSLPSAVLYNFEWPYLWNGSSDPIRIWF